MVDRRYAVLFLCTGNSARSIMAEAALNRHGGDRFVGYSAGSHAKGQVHPLTLETLSRFKYDVSGFRSKNWDEFAAPDAPKLDFVFTVCDSAAGEVCPIFPGQPMKAHWGVPDPVAAAGDDAARLRAFRNAYIELERRVQIFTNLRLEALDRLALQRRLDDIGHTVDA